MVEVGYPPSTLHLTPTQFGALSGVIGSLVLLIIILVVAVLLIAILRYTRSEPKAKAPVRIQAVNE